MPHMTAPSTPTTSSMIPAPQRARGFPVDIWWGLGFFLSHPRQWFAPLCGTAVLALVVVSITIAVGWWWWPEGEGSWWSTLWRGSRSIALAIIAGVVAWTVLLPVMLALAYEQLQKAVLVRYGIAAPGERLLPGITGSLRAVLASLPARGMWLLLTLVFAWILPPAAIIAGLWGLGYASCRDAYDSALAVRGIPYQQRRVLVADAGTSLLSAGASAALLQSLLLLTIVGWLFWLPSVFCAAARSVARDGNCSRPGELS